MADRSLKRNDGTAHQESPERIEVDAIFRKLKKVNPVFYRHVVALVKIMLNKN